MDYITIPAGDSRIILEVKWDEYLPDIIKLEGNTGQIDASQLNIQDMGVQMTDGDIWD